VLEGVVRDAAGQPLAGVDVAHAAWDALVDPVTCTQADGTYRFTGLPAGPLLVAARSPALGTVRATVEIRAEQRTSWCPTLAAGPTLRGRVLDERGAGLTDLLVEAATQERTWSREQRTDERGGFEIRGCPDAALELRVRESATACPGAVRKDVHAGPEELV